MADMKKEYYEGGWHSRLETGSIEYTKPGHYEVGTLIQSEDISISIPHMQINQLIDFLFKNGYIKPQLGENRTEDIKIIHRLLDVVSNK